MSIRVKLRLIQREKITGLENRTLSFFNFLREKDRLLNYQLLPTKKLSQLNSSATIMNWRLPGILLV